MGQHGTRFSGGWGGRCTHFTSPRSLHSDQNFHTLALCRSDQIVYTLTVHTRTNSLWEWGAGEYGSYISKGLPLGDLWDGGGGSISRPVR